jgi:AraC-like DNA-binding protein
MIHKTAKGTELTLIKLKGKDYLEVKYRLVWFREEHPDWQIHTTVVHRDSTSAIVKAEIANERGLVMAMAHKCEDKQGFADFLEKAETGSIGRALALCGYGTQFCADELDEGKRIVDAPADVSKNNQAGENVAAIKEIAKESGFSSPNEFADGDYVVQKGLKKNQPLKSFQISDCDNYLSFFKTSSKSQEYKLVSKWKETLVASKN